MLGRCQPNLGSKRRVTHLDSGGRFPTEKDSLNASGLHAGVWDDAVMGHLL